MRDADYDHHKARVQAVIDRWITPLGLKWWRVQVFWYDGAIPDASERCIMSCEVDWQYVTATLRVNVSRIAEVEDDAHLEYCVLHELVHILVAEMEHPCSDDRCAQNHVERVVTTIAKAFLWVREMDTNTEDGDDVADVA